jgi:DNA-binding transcriptional regulator YiaG
MIDATLMRPDELAGRLEKLGKSQLALARALECNARSVRRWISGETELKGLSAIAVRYVLMVWAKEARTK